MIQDLKSVNIFNFCDVIYDYARLRRALLTRAPFKITMKFTFYHRKHVYSERGQLYGCSLSARKFIAQF